MNIFYLDPDPVISASMHCDQHLSKMILESAQMLCNLLPPEIAPYKPTHLKHPCVLWLAEAKENVAYTLRLAYTLNHIRERTRDTSEHASIEVLRYCEAYLLPLKFPSDYNRATGIFCGPPMFKPPYFHGSVPQAYQHYYHYKAKHWALDSKARMSYRGRSVPAFLKDSPYVSV